jgi:hypothetical protein
MTHLVVNEPTRRSRRVVASPSRLPRTDMRTRLGKRFASILAAVQSEFGPNVDPIRAAEVARLRMIAEDAQNGCLAGAVGLDKLVRVSNMAVRAERQLAAVSKARPAASGETTLANYLADLAAQQEVENAEVAAVESPEDKTGGPLAAADPGHAAPDPDIAVAADAGCAP